MHYKTIKTMVKRSIMNSKRDNQAGGGCRGGSVGGRNVADDVLRVEAAAQNPRFEEGAVPTTTTMSMSQAAANGGPVVKFAMPSAGMMGQQSSNSHPIKLSRIAGQNVGGLQSAGPLEGGEESSGSLSSEGNGATGSSLSLSSDTTESRHNGNKKAQSGKSGSPKRPPESLSAKQNNFSQSSGTSNITNSGDDAGCNNNKVSSPQNTMNLKNCNGENNTSSGSGSDSNNNGGTTSSSGRSSGNAAVVTASTGNNNTTSSGGSGDDRSSSGSGAGSGSGSGGGGNRRSGGEASAEYYYAGYSSGQAPQAAGQIAPPQAMPNMPSFASFQGAPLTASSAAAAAGPQAQPGMAPQNNSNNMGARHMVVATDEGQLPPPPQELASSSHLRHHSRHHYLTRSRGAVMPQQQALPQQAGRTAAATASDLPPQAQATGVPSDIGGPAGAATSADVRLPSHQQVQQQQRYHATHHSAQSARAQQRPQIPVPPLPPSDEQAVLQRVPRTHATVVAHDLPPPPTSSDAWSSASGSRGSSRRTSRKRSDANGASGGGGIASSPTTMGQHMVASVRLANGGTFDSVNMNDGSPSSSDSNSMGEGQQQAGAGAMHVTMDDPILRKKISLKHTTATSEQVMASSKPKLESKAPEVATGSQATGAASMPLKSEGVSALKRKLSAMSRANTNTSSDGGDDSSPDETEAVGSGSDEGYAACSERQSGSGSDSISSGDDANKKKDKGTGAQSKNKCAGVTNGSNSNSKRTETSTMSSSVLADFSSVMNEENSIALNSLSRSDSPRSSCTSLTNDDLEANNKASGGGAKKESTQAAAGTKRDSTHVAASSSAARKRSKQADLNDAKPSAVPGLTGAMKSGLSIIEKSLQQKIRSSSAHHHHTHHYHSRSTGHKMLEKSFLSAKRDLSAAEHEQLEVGNNNAAALVTAASMTASSSQQQQGARLKSTGLDAFMSDASSTQDATIYSLGQDVMAQVVSFLNPPEVHSFLTTPYSKTWLVTYTAPQELWKILCSSKPFYAKLDENVAGCNSSDTSTCSFPICNDLEMRHLFGRYRLLYTSFVRCMKYLNRLQDDALNGRTPSVYDASAASADPQADIYPYNKNTSLKAYFAKARRLVRSNRRGGGSGSSHSDATLSITPGSGDGSDESGASGKKTKVTAADVSGIVSSQNNASNSRRAGLGRSMLTDRLLRPTQDGEVDNVNLPWSCAIYSVVNWMVAFADVEGIQIMCLKCLPYLLEDESQRITAQRAGLTDSVLRAMVLFPDSIELHTVAFHTLVLLARPLGGNEGMLFHTAMVNTRGIFNNGTSSSKNGIVIMLDSMRRFAQDEILQAMSCWSLVNVALTPLQKSMLVKLGGLTVTSNAMLQHPYNAEVQFRALFALINLVIPTETRPDETEEIRQFEREIFQQLGEVGETSEKEMLDASVGQISNLVVVAMKNFCSSEAILNRACLVLHNLSLNEEYHSILLWTPNCYQMLEWCLGNYPHDHVLQQSAGGTIQRLNATLSADEELRARFTDSIRAQQQHSLELARQEAVLLQEQQEQMDIS